MTRIERRKALYNAIDTIMKIARTEELLDYWNATNGTEKDDTVFTVRSWILDELERRYPEEFGAWDADDADNDKLSSYLI